MAQRRGRAGRDETDTSLGRERGKTDDELLKRSEADDKTASDVIDASRGRADDVVARARAKADERLQSSGANSDDLATLRSERQREDETLVRERATADESLSAERDARRRALTALLASERLHTDQHLGRERDLADLAIASRDDFLAMASHDLRNMLGGIALSAASLMNIPCNEEAHDAITGHTQRIQRFTARMTRLVGDLVDIVSIEAGRLAVTPKRHDAVELIRETMDIFQPLAAAKQIWIGSDVRRGSILARYDHERILQVLANLVGNALKFTPEGGRIHILVEPLEGYVRFTVADTGAGIAPEKLAKIFDRFWQVAEPLRRSGLGLGLYISKCIVEAHGGAIWADSRVGEGSTFNFTLPAADAPSGPDLADS
jgi:signal transduction histidine kinase